MTAEEMVSVLQEIVTASRGPDGYASMEEMADAAAPKSKSAVQKMVKAALKAGRMEAAFMPRANCVGNVQRIICYRIIPS